MGPNDQKTNAPIQAKVAEVSNFRVLALFIY